MGKNVMPPPRTALQLLHTLDLATRDAQLLDVTSYQDANLLALTGGSHLITVRDDAGIATAGEISGFNNMFTPLADGPINAEGGSLHFKRSVRSGRVVESYFTLVVSSTPNDIMSFLNITSLLGPRWRKVATDYPPPPHTVVTPGLAPHSNEDIVYDYSGKKISRTVTLRFDSLAQLYSATFHVKEL